MDPDLFYRYDENRPLVNIEEGILKSVSPPGGSFYAAMTPSGQQDLIILKSREPNLRWVHFTQALLHLCDQLKVETVFSLGSMYDNVLHSDRVMSGVASNQALLSELKENGLLPINYRGPGAIHSTIMSECAKRGRQALSLWFHCPYYLEGTTHFGAVSHMCSLLSSIGGFHLDTEEMETSWKDLNSQIQKLIEKNPELQTMVHDIRKAKVKGSWASMKESVNRDGKIIQIKDFQKPR
jgi:predicted ATP-grasp superfamily ATP-dependent carboligase